MIAESASLQNLSVMNGRGAEMGDVYHFRVKDDKGNPDGTLAIEAGGPFSAEEKAALWLDNNKPRFYSVVRSVNFVSRG